MNERIKEFIKQATTYHNGGLGMEFEYFNKELFAELIVKECSDIADNFDEGPDIYLEIIKRFGVPL